MPDDSLLKVKDLSENILDLYHLRYLIDYSTRILYKPLPHKTILVCNFIIVVELFIFMYYIYLFHIDIFPVKL